jgi:Prefoldin subunit
MMRCSQTTAYAIQYTRKLRYVVSGFISSKHFAAIEGGYLTSFFFQFKVDTAFEKVYLWIGANTMVEYSYDEAIELLELQLVQSHSKIEEISEDLFHLRGNSITVEVSMARLFNHSVKLKKLKEASDAAAAASLPAPPAIKA